MVANALGEPHLFIHRQKDRQPGTCSKQQRGRRSDTHTTFRTGKKADLTPFGKMVGLAGRWFGLPLAPEKPPKTPWSISVHQL